MQITAEQLIQAELTDSATAARVVDALNAACQKFGIDSTERVAGFLAQCSHESNGFKVTQENLNYSAAGLVKVFPKYFGENLAAIYAKQPQRIANRVYGGRMGNGPEASGDGYKYRGRGFIQLTGKDNYNAFGLAIGEDVAANPDEVSTSKYAALSAAWFWSAHGLNALADAKDIVSMTKRINGGTIGLDERKKLYEQALAVFA